MNGSNRKRYRKPWLTVEEQVKLLIDRGLKIDDQEKATSFLLHVNYYRFSGYCLAFENSRHSFSPGTRLEDIKHAYDFDTKLRDLFTEALELIEIDLRTVTAHCFGKSYGAFGHTKPTNFHDKFDYKKKHQTWIAKVREETERSSELFIHHFKRNYNQFPDLPVWIVTELMSFGGLSRMIAGMNKKDRRTISSQYGLSPGVLSKLTHHLVYVRNLCAHHCRLWDRNWNVKAELPDRSEWRKPYTFSNAKLFSTVLLMKTMLSRSEAIEPDTQDWCFRITALLGNPPSAANANGIMGIPEDWQEHSLWV